MVRALVNIFDHEDKIVDEAREKYGFKNKNDALNFIIRKFEVTLQEGKKIEKELMQDLEGKREKEKIAESIFEGKGKAGRGKSKKKGTKKLKDERGKQSIASLKNILSER